MVLAEYMLKDPSKIDKSFVSNLLSNGVKKTDMCCFIVQFFASHLLTDNAWVMKTVIDYLNAVENCRPSDNERVVLLFLDVFRLIEQCPKKNYKFISENDTIQNKHLFQEEIDNILYHGREHENSTLIPLKELLTEDVYALVSILDDLLTFPIDIETSTQKTFFIIRYLLILPPRKYVKPGHKGGMDMCDYLFWLCMSFARKTECSNALQSYVSLAKDLFYYRLRKKDKMSRINILFFTLHVIIKRRVKYQQVDFVSQLHNLVERNDDPANNNTKTESLSVVPAVENEVVEEQTKTTQGRKKTSHRPKDVESSSDLKAEKVKAKCQYLFFFSHYDEHKMQMLQAERQRKEMMTKLMRTSVKEVEIDSLLMRDGRDDVKITKLQR